MVDGTAHACSSIRLTIFPVRLSIKLRKVVKLGGECEIGTRTERMFLMNKPSISRLFGFRGYVKGYFFDYNYWKVNEWYCRRFCDACLISKDIQKGIDIGMKYRGIAYKDVVINSVV